MIVKALHDAGMKSEHAYLAAFASIGASVLTWNASTQVENAKVDRADPTAGASSSASGPPPSWPWASP
ncbi:hypothetical protein ABZ820_09965 [Streptomyces diacarni]|uniref:hypothetical protein n=1 Tax=Streptomyces diacarni TaxID=2800381 RepID=UPI0033F033D6